MEDKEQKNSLSSGIGWTLGGQLAYMFVGLVANVILARLLSPSEFGQIAICMFFIMFVNVLVESGFGGALIRMQDVKNEDYFTVFTFNLIVSLLFSIITFLFSDLIAYYYSDLSLSKILKVFSIIPLLNAFQITYNARLVKEMLFKKRAIYKLFTLLLATIISILFAYLGYGVWSIVALQVLVSFFLTLAYLFFESNLVKLKFSKESFNKMYSFGINTTLASLLNTAFDNIYQLILGKYFSLNQVGLYYQSKRLQEVPDNMFKMVILNVFYSHLSKFQGDPLEFNKHYERITILGLVVIALTTCIVVIFSDTIIIMLYGYKWLHASFYLQLLAISSFFYIQEMVNRNIFKIFDKTKNILYLEIFKKLIQSLTIIAGIYFLNITYLLLGYIFSSIVSYVLNYIYSGKVVNKSSSLEIKNLIKSIFIVTGLIICSLLVFEAINANILEKLYFVPVVILVYFLSVKFFGIFDVVKEIKLYKNIR